MDKEEDDEMEDDNIKEENEEGNGGSNGNDSKSRAELLLDALVDHGDDSQVNEKEVHKPAVKYGSPTGKWKEGKKALRPLTS